MSFAVAGQVTCAAGVLVPAVPATLRTVPLGDESPILGRNVYRIPDSVTSVGNIERLPSPFMDVLAKKQTSTFSAW